MSEQPSVEALVERVRQALPSYSATRGRAYAAHRALDSLTAALHSRELPCQECGGENPVWWVDDDLWNAARGTAENPRGEGIIVCPSCFVRPLTAALERAERERDDWKETAEREMEGWQLAVDRGRALEAAEARAQKAEAVVEAAREALRACTRSSSRDPAQKREAGRKRKIALDALTAYDEWKPQEC